MKKEWKFIEAHVIGQERKRAMFIEEAIEPVIGHTEFAQKRSRDLLIKLTNVEDNDDGRKLYVAINYRCCTWNMIIECVLTDTFGAVKISDELVSCVFVQLGPGPNQNTSFQTEHSTEVLYF